MVMNSNTTLVSINQEIADNDYVTFTHSNTTLVSINQKKLL